MIEKWKEVIINGCFNREQIKTVKQKKEKDNREESKQLSSSLNGRKAIQDVSLAPFLNL